MSNKYIIPTNQFTHTFLTILLSLATYHASTLHAEPSDQFKRRDNDRNGILEGDELRGIPSGLLKRLDQNEDGRVSAEEDEVLFKTPPAQYEVQTFNYASTKNPRQELDVLIPHQIQNSRLPCLIFIHGGGWRSGNKRQGQPHLQSYVNSQQFIGVTIGYRLSDEQVWPAQLHDCKAAIRFLYANAKKLNIDTNRLVVFGTSAGGHLAAAIATTGNAPTLNGQIGRHLTQPSAVAGAISYYGPTDFQRMDDFPCKFKHDAPDSPESRLIGSPIQSAPGKTQAANPITYVDSHDPPLMCIHGDSDNLVPINQSELLNEALRKQNVPTALIKIIGGGHGGFINPDIKKVERQFIDAIISHSDKLPESMVLPNKPK